MLERSHGLIRSGARGDRHAGCHQRIGNLEITGQRHM
jgi:hypothetical protein